VLTTTLWGVSFTPFLIGFLSESDVSGLGGWYWLMLLLPSIVTAVDVPCLAAALRTQCLRPCLRPCCSDAASFALLSSPDSIVAGRDAGLHIGWDWVAHLRSDAFVVLPVDVLALVPWWALPHAPAELHFLRLLRAGKLPYLAQLFAPSVASTHRLWVYELAEIAGAFLLAVHVAACLIHHLAEPAFYLAAPSADNSAVIGSDAADDDATPPPPGPLPPYSAAANANASFGSTVGSMDALLSLSSSSRTLKEPMHLAYSRACFSAVALFTGEPNAGDLLLTGAWPMLLGSLLMFICALHMQASHARASHVHSLQPHPPSASASASASASPS
jgi:hypothetical protein